jgi:hypothetical protein
MDVVFLPGTPPIDDKATRARIDREADQRGPFSLVIVDTSAAYFRGDDENGMQLKTHAQMLRTLTQLPGGPVVLVTCHPVKNYDPNNLLPRGAGLFLNEIDGNLVVLKDPSSGVVTIDTHGKFRGAEFAPFSFKLIPGTSELLKDTKGRLITTITALPITTDEKQDLEDIGLDREQQVLLALHAQPKASLSELAQTLGWFYKNGEPNRSQVDRVIRKLVGDHMLRKKDNYHELTKRGTDKVAELQQSAKSFSFDIEKMWAAQRKRDQQQGG